LHWSIRPVESSEAIGESSLVGRTCTLIATWYRSQEETNAETDAETDGQTDGQTVLGKDTKKRGEKE